MYLIDLLLLVETAHNIHTQSTQFEIKLDQSFIKEKLTGRAFINISKTKDVEPRLQRGGTQIFGVDSEEIVS